MNDPSISGSIPSQAPRLSPTTAHKKQNLTQQGLIQVAQTALQRSSSADLQPPPSFNEKKIDDLTAQINTIFEKRIITTKEGEKEKSTLEKLLKSLFHTALKGSPSFRGKDRLSKTSNPEKKEELQVEGTNAKTQMALRSLVSDHLEVEGDEAEKALSVIQKHRRLVSEFAEEASKLSSEDTQTAQKAKTACLEKMQKSLESVQDGGDHCVDNGKGMRSALFTLGYKGHNIGIEFRKKEDKLSLIIHDRGANTKLKEQLQEKKFQSIESMGKTYSKTSIAFNIPDAMVLDEDFFNTLLSFQAEDPSIQTKDTQNSNPEDAPIDPGITFYKTVLEKLGENHLEESDTETQLSGLIEQNKKNYTNKENLTSSHNQLIRKKNALMGLSNDLLSKNNAYIETHKSFFEEIQNKDENIEKRKELLSNMKEAIKDLQTHMRSINAALKEESKDTQLETTIKAIDTQIEAYASLLGNPAEYKSYVAIQNTLVDLLKNVKDSFNEKLSQEMETLDKEISLKKEQISSLEAKSSENEKQIKELKEQLISENPSYHSRQTYGTCVESNVTGAEKALLEDFSPQTAQNLPRQLKQFTIDVLCHHATKHIQQSGEETSKELTQLKDDAEILIQASQSRKTQLSEKIQGEEKSAHNLETLKGKISRFTNPSSGLLKNVNELVNQHNQSKEDPSKRYTDCLGGLKEAHQDLVEAFTPYKSMPQCKGLLNTLEKNLQDIEEDLNTFQALEEEKETINSLYEEEVKSIQSLFEEEVETIQNKLDADYGLLSQDPISMTGFSFLEDEDQSLIDAINTSNQTLKEAKENLEQNQDGLRKIIKDIQAVNQEIQAIEDTDDIKKYNALVGKKNALGPSFQELKKELKEASNVDGYNAVVNKHNALVAKQKSLSNSIKEIKKRSISRYEELVKNQKKLIGEEKELRKQEDTSMQNIEQIQKKQEEQLKELQDKIYINAQKKLDKKSQEQINKTKQATEKKQNELKSELEKKGKSLEENLDKQQKCKGNLNTHITTTRQIPKQLKTL